MLCDRAAMAAADVAFDGDTSVFRRLGFGTPVRENDDERGVREGFEGIAELAAPDDEAAVELQPLGDRNDDDSDSAPLLAGEGRAVDGAESTSWLANTCFLLIGVGVAISWTVCRAGIAYFSGHYPLGPSFYTAIQVAYNVPVLPLLVAQMLWDAHFDSLYGSVRTYTFRFSVGMLVMAGCLLIVPYASQTLALVAIALVGVFDSVAFGTAAQFFSAFPRAASGYYFLGSSLTSLLSIALTFATGFDADTPSALSVQLMYFGAAAIVIVGFVAAIVLIYSPIGQHFLRLKDEHLRLSVKHVQMAAVVVDDDAGSINAPSPRAVVADPASANMTNQQLLQVTFTCHIALLLCWFSTNSIDSLIAFVPSAADTPTSTNKPFRLLILYASLLGELAGKQLNVSRRGRIVKSPCGLLIVVIIRAFAALPFLLYVLQPYLSSTSQYVWRMDALVVVYQAAFDMSGAYCSSLTYSMASNALSTSAQRAQSSTLLAITLMLGVYAGLGFSVGMSRVLTAISPNAL